jgi:N-acyl-D-aspartate/D-glutamate deacylase
MNTSNVYCSDKMVSCSAFLMVCLSAFFWPVFLCAAESRVQYDLVLRNGTIVDGSGSPAFVEDIGIIDGRIARVGKLGTFTAVEEIDVQGLVVAPGFIDSHSHTDEGLIDPALKTNQGFVTQGVTTSVFGVDGGHSLQAIEDIQRTFERQGVGTNYMFYIGHNGLRQQVMGMADRAPTPDERQRMKDITREAMQQGMLGLSSGLMYLPGRYSQRDELVELAKITSELDGLYDSHIRDPANHLIESITECLETAELAGVEPHLAHLKAVGKRNFGSSVRIVELINGTRARGIPVTADVYPYDGAAARKLIAVLVPPAGSAMALKQGQLEDSSLPGAQRQVLEEELSRYWQSTLTKPELRQQIRLATEQPPSGVFSWVDAVGYGSFRIVVSNNPQYQGRMLVDLAREQGREPFDVIAELILAEGEHAKITLGAIDEAEVRYFLQQPWVMISSDGKLSGLAVDSGHPRFRGTFPRVLGRYVREWGVLGLEDAVRKMTSLPADYLKLKDRGLLAEGYWADITVFDPGEVIDKATWEQPALFSEGIVHVIMNGGFALRDGAMTGETHGRFLPYQDRQP